MICISVADISQIEKINELQPDMLELRLDLMQEDPTVIMDRIQGTPKIIATYRPGKESDTNRSQLLKKMIDRGLAFVDLEIESDIQFRKELIEYARSKNTEVIVSWHDFEHTPSRSDLEKVMARCYDMGADIAKIACMVNSEDDNANLLSLYSLKGRKVILGMGELGKITRLAAKKLGAEFTFVSSDDKHATAPGQLTVGDFITLNKILQSS